MSNGDKLKKVQGDKAGKQKKIQNKKIDDRIKTKSKLQTQGKKLDSPPALNKVYQFNNLSKPEKEKALKAQEQYNKISNFHKPFNDLTKAANKSTLGLIRGKLTLDISEKQLKSLTIPKLVKEVMINQLKGQIQSTALSKVLGKKATAWLGLLQELSNVQKQLANENLFKGNKKVATEKQFKAKIRLLTNVMAIGVSKQLWRDAPKVKGYNPNAIQTQLHDNYWKYDKAYQNYLSFIDKDKKQGLKKRDPQEFDRLRREQHPKFEQGKRK